MVVKPVFAGSVLSEQEIDMLGAQMRIGGVLSSNEIVCTQLAVFPHWSCAVHVL
jgi:hypothetical protein